MPHEFLLYGQGRSCQKAVLRKRFGSSGWECTAILNALDAASDIYFDRVSQIRMDTRQDRWTRGRISLVGDAASCVSLLAGQGSALAMIAAYILAGELPNAWRLQACVPKIPRFVSPFVLKKQQAALRYAGSFAPRSKLSLFVRNQMMNLIRIPWVANRVVGSDFADKIAIPQY